MNEFQNSHIALYIDILDLISMIVVNMEMVEIIHLAIDVISFKCRATDLRRVPKEPPPCRAVVRRDSRVV